MMYKFYPFKKVDFWLIVRMHMYYYGKLDHKQTTYLCFSILLHIHKTDSEVKMRVHLSAFSTTTSARSIYFSDQFLITLMFFVHQVFAAV